MKSKPEMSAEFKKFDSTARQVLSVSKEELQRREAAYQAERSGKPKRGQSLRLRLPATRIPKRIQSPLDC